MAHVGRRVPLGYLPAVAPPREDLPSFRAAFWGAAGLSLLLWLIPFGGLLIYPVTVMATWAHELGHGLTAILVGGELDSLELFAGGGGVAHTRTTEGWQHALVSLGGLLGAPIAGVVMLMLGSYRRMVPVLLGGLVLALTVSALLWVRSAFGIVACLAIAALVATLGWRLRPSRRFLLVQFIGIQLALSSLSRMDYLFTGEARFGPMTVMPSDVANIAEALGGHWLMWGLPIALVELAMLYGAYRFVDWRLDEPET